MRQFDYEPPEPRGGDMRSAFRALFQGVTVLNFLLTIGIIIALAFLFKRTYYATPATSNGTAVADPNTALGGALDGTLGNALLRNQPGPSGIMCPDDRRPVQIFIHANRTMGTWACALYDDIPIPPGGVLAGTLGNASFAPVGPFFSCGGPGLDCNITYYGTPYPVCVCTAREAAPEPVVNIYYGSNETANATEVNTTADGVVFGPLNATQFKETPVPGTYGGLSEICEYTYSVGLTHPTAINCVPRPAEINTTNITVGGPVIQGILGNLTIIGGPATGTYGGSTEICTLVTGNGIVQSITCEARPAAPNVTVGGTLLQGPLSNIRFITGPEAGQYGGFDKDCTFTIENRQLVALNCSTRPLPTFQENTTIILVEANITLSGDVTGDPENNKFAVYQVPGAYGGLDEICTHTFPANSVVAAITCVARPAPVDPTVGGPVIAGPLANLTFLAGPATAFYGGTNQDCTFNVSNRFVTNISCAARPAYNPETIVLAGDVIGSPGANALISRGVAGTYPGDGTLTTYTFNDKGLLTGVARGSSAVLLNTTVAGGPVIQGVFGNLTFVAGPATAFYGGANQDCTFNVSNRFVTNISCAARAAYNPETIVMAGDVIGSPGANTLINRFVTATTLRLPCDLTYIGKGLITGNATECVNAFVNTSHSLGNALYFSGNASALTLLPRGVAGTYPGDGTLPTLTFNDVGILTGAVRGTSLVLLNTTAIGGTALTGTIASPSFIAKGFGAGSCGNETHTVAFISWDVYGHLNAAPQCATYAVVASSNETTFLGTVNQVILDTSTPNQIVFSTPQDLDTAADFQVASLTATSSAHVGPISTRLGTAQHTVTAARPNTEYYVAGGSGYPIFQTGVLGANSHYIVSNAFYNAAGTRIASATGVRSSTIMFGGNGLINIGSSEASTAGSPTGGEIVYLALTHTYMVANVLLRAAGTVYVGTSSNYDSSTSAGNNQFVIMGTTTEATKFAQIEFKNNGSAHPNLHLASVDTTRQFLSFGGYRLDTSYRVGATTDDIFLLERNGNTFTMQYQPPGTAGTATTPVILQAQTRSLAYVTTPLEARSTFRAGVPRSYAGDSSFVVFEGGSGNPAALIDLVGSHSTYPSGQIGAFGFGGGFVAFDMARDTTVGNFRTTSASNHGFLLYKGPGFLTLSFSVPGVVGALATVVDFAEITPTLVSITPPVEVLSTFRAGPPTTYAGTSPFVLFGPVAAATSPVLDFVIAGNVYATVQVGTVGTTTGFIAFGMARTVSGYVATRDLTSGILIYRTSGELFIQHTTAATAGTLVTPVTLAKFAEDEIAFERIALLKGGFVAGPSSARTGTNKYSIGGDATINLEIYATGQTQPRGNAYTFLAAGNSHIAFDAYHDGANYRFASASQAGLLLRKTTNMFAVQFNPVATTPTLGGAFTPETRFSVTSATTTVHNSLLVESTIAGVGSHIRLRGVGASRPHTELATFAAANSYLAFDMNYDGAWVFTASSTRAYVLYKLNNGFFFQTTNTAAGTAGGAATRLDVWSANGQDMTITTAPIISAFSADVGKNVIVGTSGRLAVDTSLYTTPTTSTMVSEGASIATFTFTYQRLAGSLVAVSIHRSGTLAMVANGCIAFPVFLPLALAPVGEEACSYVSDLYNGLGWTMRLCVLPTGNANLCPVNAAGGRGFATIFISSDIIRMSVHALTYFRT